MAELMEETVLLAPNMPVSEEKVMKLGHSMSLSVISTEDPASPSMGQKADHFSIISFSSEMSSPRWDSSTAETIQRAKGYGTQLEALSLQTFEMKLDPQSGLIVQSQIKDRMVARAAYVRGLYDKCRNVDVVLSELRDSTAMLKRAIWSKWAPLCVARERIRIRSTKPPQEQHPDEWQSALEIEEATLVESRQKLLKLVKETKAWISMLTQAKQNMLDDLNRKRRVGKVDHTVLLEGYGKGIHLANECKFLPLKHAMELIRRPDTSHVDANEETELSDVNDTFAEADQYITCARSQIKENKIVSQEKSRLCLAANTVSSSNMNLHIAYLQSCVKQLRDLISECEQHICRGELAMDVASYRLNRSADPIRRISRQYSARMNHHDQANLPMDRVYEKLDERFDAVKAFIDTISSHMELTTEVMESLRETKRLLEQARDMKQKALQIDGLCVKEKREWIKTSSVFAFGD